MAKMWEGRFTKELDREADDFNSSLHFDCKMYKQDIKGSMAHAAMLAAQNIISKSDADIIIDTLSAILGDIDSGALDFSAGGEDIHMFVEAELTKRIGDIGKRLHTARSRNDQVALDIRLYLRDETNEIIELLKTLGVKGFITTKKGTNSYSPNWDMIRRIELRKFTPEKFKINLMIGRNLLLGKIYGWVS